MRFFYRLTVKFKDKKWSNWEIRISQRSKASPKRTIKAGEAETERAFKTSCTNWGQKQI